MTEIIKKATQARKEATWWQYAAWTLPFTALAVLGFEYWIGLDTWYHRTLVSITVIFFTISVFWWWWAVRKFADLMESMKKTDENFNEVKENLRSIRNDLKDDSFREWRKPKKR